MLEGVRAHVGTVLCQRRRKKKEKDGNFWTMSPRVEKNFFSDSVNQSDFDD